MNMNNLLLAAVALSVCVCVVSGQCPTFQTAHGVIDLNNVGTQSVQITQNYQGSRAEYLWEFNLCTPQTGHGCQGAAYVMQIDSKGGCTSDATTITTSMQYNADINAVTVTYSGQVTIAQLTITCGPRAIASEGTINIVQQGNQYLFPIALSMSGACPRSAPPVPSISPVGPTTNTFTQTRCSDTQCSVDCNSITIQEYQCFLMQGGNQTARGSCTSDYLNLNVYENPLACSGYSFPQIVALGTCVVNEDGTSQVTTC